MLFVLHLCKIMVENTKCDTVTIDFSSDTTKCKICQKLVHYSCVEVNLLSNFMFDVAYCWYSDHCYDAFAIMYTNDDQIVTMNAISNTSSNFDFYHLILALAITASCLNMLTNSLHIYLFTLYVLNTCYLYCIYAKLWSRIQNVTLLLLIFHQIQPNAKFVRNWCIIRVLKLIYFLILCLMLHIAGILIIAMMHLLSCTLMMIKLSL